MALKGALEKRNHQVEIINWDNDHYDFSLNDCTIIRSCWDYDQRVDEFLDKLSRIDKMSILINSFEILKENANKTYLKLLEVKGVPIVTSYFLDRMDQVHDILRQVQSDTIVIKPSVSASGRRTYRMRRDDPEVFSTIKSILATGSVMIQPYLASVESQGERSTVVVNGEVVFTMLKTPAPGNFLVHNHKGGTYSRDQVRVQDKAFVEKVIRNLPDETAYARIDYLYENDQAKLLELELIEPNLYLDENPRGLELLCDYIENIKKDA